MTFFQSGSKTEPLKKKKSRGDICARRPFTSPVWRCWSQFRARITNTLLQRHERVTAGIHSYIVSEHRVWVSVSRSVIIPEIHSIFHLYLSKKVLHVAFQVFPVLEIISLLALDFGVFISPYQQTALIKSSVQSIKVDKWK